MHMCDNCGFIFSETNPSCRSCIALRGNPKPFKEKKLKVNESYIIGVDITEGDESSITVVKQEGSTLEIINTITGTTADLIYLVLMNKVSINIKNPGLTMEEATKGLVNASKLLKPKA